MVRGHADEIFDTEQEKLSVQEVRRREEAAEIEDLTPLPTTDNTETIDNFASYGPGGREWSPGAGWPAIPRAKTATAMTQLTAITQPDVPSQQQTGTIVSSATSHAVNNNHPISDTLSMASSSPVDTMAPNQLAELGEQTSPSSSSSVVRVHSNVSALSGRGMSVPVKVKPNKNKPAAASPSSEANDSVPGDGVMEKPKVKQAPTVEAKQNRGKKRAAPSSSSPEVDASSTNNGDHSTAHTPESTPSPAKKLKITGPRKASPPTKKTTSKPRKAATLPARNIEAVIAGNALPQNAAEANAASATRHVRLLARHLNLHPEAEEDTDLLPEFFNAATFKPEAEEVRCICLLAEDNEDGWLSCDKCSVWQHAKCMGVSFAAYTKNTKKKYMCHVCDPWEHRKKIAGLRKKNLLP